MEYPIIVVGLGFGDEGKGSCVDYLTRENNADLVVRYNGGHQAAHTVVLPNGDSHIFSQFGSGTFAGADTYLGRNVIIEPMAMYNELKHIRSLTNASVDTFSALSDPAITVHPNALVTAPYHKLLNQITEQQRGKGKHGSCGVGIGETRKYWLDYGEDSLFACDMRSPDTVRRKLELMHQRMLAHLFETNGAEDLKQVFYNLSPTDITEDLLNDIPFRCQDDSILEDHDTVIFEGAQGVLLDENYGFHPHTTWSTTTSYHADEMVRGHDVERIGIIRTYHTRHGAGPLPTENSVISLVDKNNPVGVYQGGMRFGYFDKQLFQYALSVQPVDGVFLTHMDEDLGKCASYPWPTEISFPSRKRQESLAQSLTDRVATLAPGTAYDEIRKHTTILYESHGPTYEDKRRSNAGISV